MGRVETLYGDHLARGLRETRAIIENQNLDGILFHSGTPVPYHADDIFPPFKTVAHFARFAPLTTPHALLLVTGNRAYLIEVQPEDYWEDHEDYANPFWRDGFDSNIVSTPEDAWKVIAPGIGKRIAFIGDSPSSLHARKYGIHTELENPEAVISALNQSRTLKSDFEIENIREANRISAEGHTVAKEAFQNGASEIEIHYVYLKALGVTERELPYPTIVALNEKAGILHYDKKRHNTNGHVLLLDAGACSRGYASDITRTYLHSDNDLFQRLLTGLEKLQLNLVDSVRVGVPFIELHHEAHLGIATILKENDIIRVEPHTAIEKGITKTFFPHGLGHMLGLQVHDVGSAVSHGVVHPLQKLYPTLRTGAVLSNSNVITVEPGIYFIPLLLNKLRAMEPTAVSWEAVETLAPCGGMRIEDDVVVTQDGRENLTRLFLG